MMHCFQLLQIARIAVHGLKLDGGRPFTSMDTREHPRHQDAVNACSGLPDGVPLAKHVVIF